MPAVEYFTWILPGQRKATRHKMDRETAQERHPGAVPVEASREIRDCQGPGDASGRDQAGHVLDGPSHVQ